MNHCNTANDIYAEYLPAGKVAPIGCPGYGPALQRGHVRVVVTVVVIVVVVEAAGDGFPEPRPHGAIDDKIHAGVDHE